MCRTRSAGACPPRTCPSVVQDRPILKLRSGDRNLQRGTAGGAVANRAYGLRRSRSPDLDLLGCSAGACPPRCRFGEGNPLACACGMRGPSPYVPPAHPEHPEHPAPDAREIKVLRTFSPRCCAGSIDIKVFQTFSRCSCFSFLFTAATCPSVVQECPILNGRERD